MQVFNTAQSKKSFHPKKMPLVLGIDCGLCGGSSIVKFTDEDMMKKNYVQLNSSTDGRFHRQTKDFVDQMSPPIPLPLTTLLRRGKCPPSYYAKNCEA